MYKIEIADTEMLQEKRKTNLPFAKLSVGTYFFVPAEEISYGAIRVAAHRYSQANNVRLRVRKTDGGYCVVRLPQEIEQSPEPEF